MDVSPCSGLEVQAPCCAQQGAAKSHGILQTKNNHSTLNEEVHILAWSWCTFHTFFATSCFKCVSCMLFWICLHCSQCSYSKPCRNIKHIWNMDLKAFGRRISLRLLVWLFVSIINAIKAGLIHRGWDLLVTMMTYSDNRIMIIKMSITNAVSTQQRSRPLSSLQALPPPVTSPNLETWNNVSGFCCDVR